MPEEQNSPDPTELTSTDPAQVPAILAGITVTRSDGYKTIYSNVVRTRLGIGDITMIFSRITHSPSVLAAANIIEEQIEVVMSWTNLKMFEQVLRPIVDTLDQEVGVPLPTTYQVNEERQRALVREMGFPSPAKK